MRLIIFIAAFLITACSDLNKQKLLDTSNTEAKAAVISGCMQDYKDEFLFAEVNVKQDCVSIWQDSSGNQFFIGGLFQIKFVNPGIYEFVGYKSKNSDRFSYKKRENTISIFNTIDLQPGAVVYIGNLSIDSKKTKLALGAMSFIQNPEAAKKYLNSVYPSLTNKMQLYKVDFSPEAWVMKNLLLSN